MTDASALDFSHPKYFINRELSWLEFNARVLEEAQDPTNPLLERLKFLAIFASNLDEFFMIRVANLRDLESAGIHDTPADGLTPSEQLDAIAERAHELVDAHTTCMMQDVRPALARHGLRVHRVDTLTKTERDRLREMFEGEIFPVLTPMTVDPSHPFPHLPNLSLNLLVVFEQDDDGEGQAFALVEIPAVLGSLIAIREQRSGHDFVLMSDIIRAHVGDLFPGLTVAGSWLFRVTRNADLSLEEQEVENLLQDLERELRSRTFRPPVRVEIEADMPGEMLDVIKDGLELGEREIYRIDGLLHAPRLWPLAKADGYRHLKDPPFNPRLNPRLATTGSIFSILREGDLMLYHPFESFSTVVELLQHAAHDPKVLAIKMTLYRTSGDSVIIQALKDAAENGKQVTALVELKARFDEKNNIVWARELERAGCHVVYGIVGLKTHCKAALVVRRERGRVRRYVHLGTGNYNSATARLYTDLGLLTSDDAIGEDVSQLFNILTGYSGQTIREIMAGARAKPAFQKLYTSPFDMRDHLVSLIDREAELHSDDDPGLIQAKFNSLVDPSIIEALYRASTAGVRIELNVRGICCLRPGIPGVSENIRITSIVDRFLEHPRIFYFRHGGADLCFASSADWMPRNLYRRIETLFPIEDPRLKHRMIHELLAIPLADTVKARQLNADGRYTRVKPADGEAPLRSQTRFIELAREAGIKSDPYDVEIREARKRRKKARSW